MITKLISSFPGCFAPGQSVESAGKGNRVAHLCHLPEFATKPTTASFRNIPPTPFYNLAPSKRATFPSVALYSRLTLIQLKTSDDRAKQRRINHENFNWCYRYKRGWLPSGKGSLLHAREMCAKVFIITIFITIFFYLFYLRFLLYNMYNDKLGNSVVR